MGCDFELRAYDIIEKKRDGHELSKKEICYMVEGYTDSEIPDYQMSAFLMAVYIRGMTEKECQMLTESMLNSGDIINLSKINGVKVDKHSTGGVGDKTTLIIAPIVACCGAKVAKMSGRGLGHTGGTIDKLESLQGMKVDIEKEKFFQTVNSVGCCIASQTGNLVPADKKMYALRDVTATVESMPLIASSIMSKKLASGADCILLDVKKGSGAFMKNTEDAVALSKLMVNIGKKFKKNVMAVITQMDEPLGNAIGNFIEVWESYEVLSGRGPTDLVEISLYLASHMLFMAGIGSVEECREMAEKSIKDGSALKKFKEMIFAQGGHFPFNGEENYVSCSKIKYECVSPENGYIESMHSDELGKAAMILGAGRQTKEEIIDPYAGIMLNKKIGDAVKKGEVIATLYTSEFSKCKEAEAILKKSVKISKVKPAKPAKILAKVTSENVEIY